MDQNTANTVAIFNENAELYQEQFMDVTLYADTLDQFCQQIKLKNAEILEVGSGPGNLTKYLKNKRPDFKILATDLSEKMLVLAKQNVANVTFKSLDLNDINSITIKFDGIVCGFCLPYLSEIELSDFICNASNLLTDIGIFYLSTMEDDPEKSGFKKSTSGNGGSIFINYYRLDYLAQLLKNK